MWNATEGNWRPEDQRARQVQSRRPAQAARTASASVCPKSGQARSIETDTITFHPGQKDVLIPIDSNVLINDAAAFVVSICSQGPLGVTQSRGIVGIRQRHERRERHSPEHTGE